MRLANPTVAHSISHSRHSIHEPGELSPFEPMTFEDGQKRARREPLDELRRKRDEFQRLASVTHDPVVAEELSELANIYAKLVAEAEAAARAGTGERGKPAPKA